MTDLSPAARAVWEAFMYSKFDWVEDGVPGPQFHSVAAALRAVADQVVPEGFADAYDCCLEIVAEIRDDILAIAAELEGADG